MKKVYMVCFINDNGVSTSTRCIFSRRSAAQSNVAFLAEKYPDIKYLVEEVSLF